jgi:LPS export ABC transporter permease LptG/LPS export ABC transporter permease LptF
MRKIDKLLYLAIIPPFLITVTILTFVLSVQYLGALSELLITRNASFGSILLITAAIIPATLIFSLPLSYLIGILIGLSGLSGESQITALRACGVPIRTLLRPILLFGAVVAAVTGIVTMIILPRTNDVIGRVKNSVSLAQATSQIQPRVFNGGNDDFPNIVFYIDDLAVDKQRWSRVFLADNSDPKAPRTIMAQSGTWINDSSNRRLQLHLEGGKSYAIDPANPSKDTVSMFASTDIPISLNPRFTAVPAEDRVRKVVEQSTGYLWSNYRKSPPPLRLEQLIELNRRIALPFSIIPFALLGLALSVSTPKGGRTSGFALSLVLVLLFYTLFANGIRLASVGKVSPFFGAWGANIILSALGLAFFYRVEQSHAIGHLISRLFWKFGWIDFGRRFRLDSVRSRVIRLDDRIFESTTARVARFSFPKVLDIYISRGFLGYFFWSLMTCGTLFVLFTLFDLLDDIIRNKIPSSTVLDYFTFFTPQILMLVVPMSVLLGVLINFGILEKNSEITAIKSGGWSLYRIAVPVFLMASGLCVGLFLLQDYILPYANVVQDDLHNRIKGKPPQTSMRLQRKWIFGESNRIYNYEYFDGNQRSFVDLNVYDIDLEKAKVLRRTRAARARIDSNGIWTLEDGWIRDYESAQYGFRQITKETTRFPEKADYFEKEIFQPKESSKMTYPELSGYINYLMKSGYNATELQVELHKKISFPLSCLVMALLGVPFSFSTGKKGALFGIGMSIAIAISYWGLSGVFEAMGAYGLLVPILAAWAPNLLFGAAGLALLFTIRT